MKIQDKIIENFGKPFIIAEIGSNHNGRLELAKELIDKAIDAGADSVKFQNFDLTLFSKVSYETDERRRGVMDISKPLEGFFTNVHPELEREMKEYMMGEEMTRQVKQYCDEKGILFFSTPFSKKSADFLVDGLGMELIKIASCDLTNHPLLEHCARKNKPMILSTGMADLLEIIEAVKVVEKTGNKQIALLHCVSIYPPQDEMVNLKNIEMLRNLFDYPIGFSDHTLGTAIPLAAAAFGACIIEKHFTLDKNLPGWDHKVSATPLELKGIVENSRRIHAARGSYQRIVTQDEIEKRTLFRRSIVVTRNLREGEILQAQDLDVRRPGVGIIPAELPKIIGRTLKVDMREDDILQYSHLL